MFHVKHPSEKVQRQGVKAPKEAIKDSLRTFRSVDAVIITGQAQGIHDETIYQCRSNRSSNPLFR